MAASIEGLGDRGYQGLQKRHAKSRTPIKQSRGCEINKAAKRHNRSLASHRIVCAHVIGKLKVFKILVDH